MLKTVLKYLLCLGLLIASQACAAPSVPTLDPNAINTAIAGTMAAARTQTAQQSILLTGESPTPTITKVPSMTPLPTFTLVVFITQVRVSKNTNCRAGPGQAYSSVGILRVGEVVEAVGRSADARYWIIRNPDRAGTLCWLSGEYATITGVAGALPVYTPPPTPKPTRTPTRVRATRPPTPKTPGFTASYSGMESCGTEWWVEIRLQNTSEVAFNSISLILEDTVNGNSFFLDSDDFTKRNGCVETRTKDVLGPGTAHLVSLPSLTYDPTGHEMYVGISLCSKPGQNGKCAIQVIKFTP